MAERRVSAGGAHAGGSPARRTASAESARVVKKARQDGSTDAGSAAHFSCKVLHEGGVAAEQKGGLGQNLVQPTSIIRHVKRVSFARALAPRTAR